MRIAVLMTCHNRREKTLGCLRALFVNDLPHDTSLHVILVDGGSTDNTAEFVRTEFPQVDILLGDGNLFWNRGMQRAFARAMVARFDGYAKLRLFELHAQVTT
jgi:GT2 family glycosyltransferase